MATIYIENKPYVVKDRQNLLQVCLSLGFNLPYFCWHPAMHSVGACRQCAVKLFRDEKDTRGKIIMSCMTLAKDGIRISIDKPEGVTHGDCELVSHQVGTILDVEDAVPGGRYTLEVSSPGLERKLLKPQDYRRFQGKKAKLTLRDPLEGRRNWEGTLAGVEAGAGALEMQAGTTMRFPLDQIQKANLKFEW